MQRAAVTSAASKFILIIETATDKVVKQIDVTGRSRKYIEKCIRGVEINLNHDDYHVENPNDTA